MGRGAPFRVGGLDTLPTLEPPLEPPPCWPHKGFAGKKAAGGLGVPCGRTPTWPDGGPRGLPAPTKAPETPSGPGWLGATPAAATSKAGSDILLTNRETLVAAKDQRHDTKWKPRVWVCQCVVTTAGTGCLKCHCQGINLCVLYQISTAPCYHAEARSTPPHPHRTQPCAKLALFAILHTCTTGTLVWRTLCTSSVVPVGAAPCTPNNNVSGGRMDGLYATIMRAFCSVGCFCDRGPP